MACNEKIWTYNIKYGYNVLQWYTIKNNICTVHTICWFLFGRVSHNCTKGNEQHVSNTLLLHNVFHSSGSLETRLHNGGVGDPPHHNCFSCLMLFMFKSMTKMLMVTVPPKTKRGNLSGTNSFRCHFIFHSSGSLETRLCNGGVGNPPHHNTMFFMFNAFHV